MSEIIKSKIADIVSAIPLKHYLMREVESCVESTFNELDYTPKDLRRALDIAWEDASPDDNLSDFVYNVWRSDS